MRLLQFDLDGTLTLTKDLPTSPSAYAILSHTWYTNDDDEPTFDDLDKKTGTDKLGYAKLWFCANQAKKDGLTYCWVDTCCINKTNHVELSESITSMFRWYQGAAKCYVYLTDVSVAACSQPGTRETWEPAFRRSRWFKRGWTLQELLAPAVVEFFSAEGHLLGTKQTLEALIHQITTIPVAALRGTSLSTFTVDERLQWTEGRDTKKPEDRAYCLQGIFGVFLPLMYGEGENAFTRLRQEIKNAADSTPSVSHTHWVVNRTPNPFFTGREDVLQELGAVIRNAVANPPHQDQCRIVITGIGGQGKSEICLKLAHLLREKFWGVFWIDVSTSSLAETSFLEVARRLALPAQTWQEACLGVANLKHPWLLVLDNADDLKLDYQPYIPSSPRGVVMVTSRNDEYQQYATAKAIALEGLTADAARDLLLKATHVPLNQRGDLEQDAIRVANLLQSHPLALIQASAYVSRGFCSLADYPAVYERQRQRLLKFHSTQARSRYGDVYATFEASADALKQSTETAARDALTLISLLAMCGASRLPLALFKAGWEDAREVPPNMAEDAADDVVELLTPWHVAQLPAFVDVSDQVWDIFRLVSAVQLLKAFALVSTEDSGEFMKVSMHPLVHVWARDRQSDAERHSHWLSMGCIVSFARMNTYLDRALDQPLQSHVEALVGWDMATMFGRSPQMLVCRVLAQCGWFLLQMRSDSRLMSLIQTLMTRLGLDATKVSKPWLGLYYLAAHAALDSGQSERAIQLLEQVVSIRTASVAADNFYQLSLQHTLAGAYQLNGQDKAALELFEKVVNAKAQSLPANHPNRLASQHELATAYQANGQVKEAVELLKEVVKIRNESLLVGHPDRLSSQHALAMAYQANGQAKEAAELLEEVVKIRSRVLSVGHPSRLASQHALAKAYQANGQIKEAVELLEEVVKIGEQVQPVDHPSRLLSQHALATVYAANGQVKEAVNLLEEVVKIRGQTSPADHRYQLVLQHELAKAYQANGQIKEAVDLLQEVVKVDEQSQTVDHPSRLASQHALAMAYHANGQIKKAEELLKEVVRIQEQSLPGDHPDRLTSELNLAVCLWEDEECERGYQLMTQVVEKYRLKFDEGHPAREWAEEWLQIFQKEKERLDEQEDTAS